MSTLIILFVAIVVIGSFIDACLQHKSKWDAVQKSKATWLVLIFFFGIFAVIPYLVSVRPKLTK
jgi:Na+/H+ antiporter NhaD/arsenite permease-like protein